MARRLAKRVALLLVVSALTLLEVRSFDAQRGPELEPWHTYGPHELNAERLAALAIQLPGHGSVPGSFADVEWADFARFAGLLGLPASSPALAQAAWLSVLPEFDRFK
jgi:hypothetical protein